MKTVRYLVSVSGVAIICAFAISAGDPKQPGVSEISVLASDTRVDALNDSPPTSQTRQILDANPTLVSWLLEMSVTKGDVECRSADCALSALAPIAAAELVKELDNKNSERRKLAMTLLAQGAGSSTFPHKEVVATLLKIAQNGKEDEAIRKHATVTVCQIICTMQGAPFHVPTQAF